MPAQKWVIASSVLFYRGSKSVSDGYFRVECREMRPTLDELDPLDFDDEHAGYPATDRALLRRAPLRLRSLRGAVEVHLHLVVWQFPKGGSDFYGSLYEGPAILGP